MQHVPGTHGALDSYSSTANSFQAQPHDTPTHNYWHSYHLKPRARSYKRLCFGGREFRARSGREADIAQLETLVFVRHRNKLEGSTCCSRGEKGDRPLERGLETSIDPRQRELLRRKMQGRGRGSDTTEGSLWLLGCFPGDRSLQP